MESHPPCSLVIIRKALSKKPRLIKFRSSNLFCCIARSLRPATCCYHCISSQKNPIFGSYRQLLPSRKYRSIGNHLKLLLFNLQTLYDQIYPSYNQWNLIHPASWLSSEKPAKKPLLIHYRMQFVNSPVFRR